MQKYDEGTELLVELLIGCLESEGCEVARYSDSKTHGTTAYDALAVKNYDGAYFNITIEKSESRRNPRTGEIIKDRDTFETLKAEKSLKSND